MKLKMISIDRILGQIMLLRNLIVGLFFFLFFFFKHGRFVGSQKLAVLLQVEVPSFIKTEIPLSPVDLYKNFPGTNAKELVSFQALAALNIHLGGDKDVSKKKH